MAFTSRRSASARISFTAPSMVAFSFLCCESEHVLVQLQRLKVSSQERHARSEAAHFHKVVEQVHALLQRLLQVVAQRQVLGVVADLLHAAPLRLLRGLLCPVLVLIIAILRPRREEGKVNLEINIMILRLFDVGLLDWKD